MKNITIKRYEGEVKKGTSPPLCEVDVAGNKFHPYSAKGLVGVVRANLSGKYPQKVVLDNKLTSADCGWPAIEGVNGLVSLNNEYFDKCSQILDRTNKSIVDLRKNVSEISENIRKSNELIDNRSERLGVLVERLNEKVDLEFE